MDITQNHCEKQLKNILVCRLIMSYNEQEFKDNSSGRGVIPHRRYSPRPMETWLNRCDSGTDSIVWMREEKVQINVCTVDCMLEKEPR